MFITEHQLHCVAPHIWRLWAILWIIKEQGIILYIPDIQKHSSVFAYEQRLAKCANTKSEDTK